MWSRDRAFFDSLARDPYYAAAARRFGTGPALDEAGFVPNVVSRPFPDPEWSRWPSLPYAKIARRLAAARSDAPVVLLSTGSFAPVHEGHLAMMKAARAALEERGVEVVAGILSPSHDAYVAHKGDGQDLYSAPRRMRLLHEALEDEDWLVADSWEAQGVAVAVNFTEVIARTQALLSRLLRPLEIVYVFGGDNAAFMRSFVEQGRAVCVRRPGYPPSPLEKEDWIDPGRHLFARALLSENVSSTQKRRALVPERPKPPCGTYVVRDDWPMVVGRWRACDVALDPAETIVGVLRAALPPGRIDLVRHDVVQQQSWAMRQLRGERRPIVSLDTFFRPGPVLDASRRFRCADSQVRAEALIGRPEAASPLACQAARIPDGDIVLVDDDRVSGSTFHFVERLLGDRTRIAGELYLADAMDRKNDIYDVVDVRDFLLGAPFGGLVVEDPAGVPIRVPYMAPYVDLATRARLDENAAMSASLALWRWNADVMEAMDRCGAHLDVTDMLVRFAMLSGHTIAHDRPFRDLARLARWHAERLEEAAP